MPRLRYWLLPTSALFGALFLFVFFLLLVNVDRNFVNVDRKFVNVDRNFVNLVRNCETAQTSAAVDNQPSADDKPRYSRDLRRVEENVKDLWFYAKTALGKEVGNAHMWDILEQVRQRKHAMMNLLEKLRKGHDDINQWKHGIHDKLSKTVQERIWAVQHPRSCGSERKKIHCEISESCGFGCSMHYIVRCMIIAYATNRTMILDAPAFPYPKDLWENLFLPFVSSDCLSSSSSSFAIKVVQENVPIVSPEYRNAEMLNLYEMPISNTTFPFLPRRIPSILSDLVAYHPQPLAWWVGQFVKYLLRYSNQARSLINRADKKLGFGKGGHPIAGIHVRETDHVGTESQHHDIDEYMEYVDDYFDRLDLAAESMGKPRIKRRLYVAADDVSTTIEVKRRYGKRYEVLGDEDIATSAEEELRFGRDGLQGLLVDMHFLSQCDYVVCIFSSSLCRLVYEKVSSEVVDTSGRFQSLDDVYYFSLQFSRPYQALYEHEPSSSYQPAGREMPLQVGQVIEMLGDHWNGYSKGSGGMYPSYKAEEVVEFINFDEFQH